MMRVIRKRLRDFVALVVLVGIASLVAFFILQNQRLRFPLLEDAPFRLKLESPTAQAVTPGQGQTVRVSGIRVGDIGDIDLVEGRAIITMELDSEYRDLVHTDASAFLRPKTGLKDMFVELDPGTKSAPLADEGWTVPVRSVLPDVNPDEFLSTLDADTRDYLRLLINGAGEGLEGRADDLREVLRRFEPTYRDLGKVNSEVAKRRVELRRLISSLAALNGELARRDDDLAELVSTSARTFRAIASERENVTDAVRELPGALAQTTRTLGSVREMATVLRPAADRIRPAIQALDRANPKVEAAAREGAPQLQEDIRPFVRALRPLVRELDPVSEHLVEAEPGLTRSGKVLNHLFNMLGHNPEGREDPGLGSRDEGYLFYLAWLAHQSVNLFSTADAHGPLRALTLGGTCGTLAQLTGAIPGIEMLLGLSGALTDPTVCGGVGGGGIAGRRAGAKKAGGR